MKLRLTCVLALAAATVLVPTAFGGGVQRIPTAVIIDHFNPHYFSAEGAPRRAPNGYDISGHVESSAAKCRRFRRITVFFVDEGPDTRLGTDVGDSNGGWSLFIPVEDADAGDYYARAAKKELRSGKICRADRSSNFTPV